MRPGMPLKRQLKKAVDELREQTEERFDVVFSVLVNFYVFVDEFL